MSISVFRIASETGLTPEHVGKELAFARDADFTDQIREEVARSFVRDVKRSQRRHQLLVSEYDGVTAEHRAEADRVYWEAFEAALKENRALLKRTTSEMGERLRASARHRSWEPARNARDEWLEKNPVPPFEKWVETRAGKQAIGRVEKILQAATAVVA